MRERDCRIEIDEDRRERRGGIDRDGKLGERRERARKKDREKERGK